jgi:hypothetical protein
VNHAIGICRILCIYYVLISYFRIGPRHIRRSLEFSSMYNPRRNWFSKCQRGQISDCRRRQRLLNCQISTPSLNTPDSCNPANTTQFRRIQPLKSSPRFVSAGQECERQQSALRASTLEAAERVERAERKVREEKVRNTHLPIFSKAVSLFECTGKRSLRFQWSEGNASADQRDTDLFPLPRSASDLGRRIVPFGRTSPPQFRLLERTLVERVCANLLGFRYNLHTCTVPSAEKLYVAAHTSRAVLPKWS